MHDSITISNLRKSSNERTFVNKVLQSVPSLRKNLLRFYPMFDIMEGKIRDYSYNETTANVVGCSRQNRGIYFDGVDDYCQEASDDNNLDFGTTTDFSVTIGFRITDINTYRTLIGKPGTGGSTSFNLAIKNTGVVSSRIGEAGATLDTTRTFEDRKDHYITLVCDRDTGVEIYVDGFLEASNSTLTNARNLANANALSIGIGGTATNPHTGYIFTAIIHDRKLGKREIEQLHGVLKL